MIKLIKHCLKYSFKNNNTDFHSRFFSSGKFEHNNGSDNNHFDTSFVYCE